MTWCSDAATTLPLPSTIEAMVDYIRLVMERAMITLGMNGEVRSAVFVLEVVSSHTA
jgi:hypothetical protein